MKLTFDKEQVLKIPTEKENENDKRNSIFAAEINENDHHLDGIVEKDESSAEFNQFKEYLQEDLSL